MNYKTDTIKGLIEFLNSLNQNMKVNKLNITTSNGSYFITEDKEDDTEKEIFIYENEEDLKAEFTEKNKKEFDNFIKNCIIDEERDIFYWIEIFCNEENEEEFKDYLNDSFKDYKEDIETKNSLINDIQKI